MSVPAWFWMLGWAARPTPPPTDLQGPFDGLPREAWAVRLPGPPPSSATHAETGGPLVVGDRIYVGHATEDALLVLSRRDGTLLARLPAGGPVQATPVVDDGRLYFTDAAGHTSCYDLDTGRRLWVHEGGAPITSAPLVTDDLVVVADVEDVFVALQRATGELAWRHAQKGDPSRQSDLELYGTPSPVQWRDAVLGGASDGTLVALDLDTGDVRWQKRVGEGPWPDIVAEPVVVGDDIVVSGYGGPTVLLDGDTREVRWRLEAGAARPPAVLEASGLLLAGGVDGVLRVVEAVSGEVAWEWDSGTGASLTTPLPLERGLLVGASGDGLVLVDDGVPTWRYEPLHHLSGVTAQPAVDGRQLLVLTDAGRLISFVSVPEAGDGGARAPAWWEVGR